MDATLPLFFCIVSLSGVYAVPPDVCYHQFRWEDCGGPPKAVIYYYKSGSRCEVGIWRGCLPNQNMFADEYECVQTCIFSLRAKEHDFHSFQGNVIESGEATIADSDTDTENTSVTSNTNTTDPEGEATEAVPEGETGDPTVEGGGEASVTTEASQPPE